VGKGDHIYVDCGAYTHHGIDCGDGTAIHYIGERLKGVISRTSMDSFSFGKKVFVRHYRIYDQPDIVIKRAETRLNEDNYDLLFNNCEHFSTWCKTGKHESEQVNRAAVATGSAGGIGVSLVGIQAMNTVNATFVISEEIAEGLRNGTLERVGGVIREPQTKQVVAWLRETTPNASQMSTLLQLGSVVSVLNLGVSVMGFAVINKRLNELEQRLQQAQEILNKLDRKIDLGFYANFHAAINLAINAMTMKKRENRESMAISAISKLLEAEHHYTAYTDSELEQRSQIADEYLLTLSLAYVAEARCHLEIDEPDIALRRLQEGASVLRPRIQRYIDLLLTSNPAAYLQPQYKGQIDLHRLTQIFQWSDPTLDENAVFDLQRENFVKFLQDPNKWVETLPPAILDRVEVAWGWFGPNPEDLKREAVKRLPQVLEVVESMIETDRRFEAFQAEVKAIDALDVSFQDWLQLTPLKEVKPDGAELMYIIPDNPLEV
jgi:hypothetical protein